MVAITSYLFEDLVVVKNTYWPGPDIPGGVPAATDQNVPVRHHIILEKGLPNEDGYARFEHIGAMSGEDWALLVGVVGTLWDLNLQAPA
jgi:hypothetical protein